MSETQESTQNAPEAVSTLNDERAHRLSKRAAIMEAGGNPYPEHSEVTAHVVDIEAKYADLEAGEDTDDVVSIGGRIMAKRGQGKIAFVVVRDTTPRSSSSAASTRCARRTGPCCRTWTWATSST